MYLISGAGVLKSSSGRGATRPPMVNVKLPKSELVVFHLLWSNEVANFFRLKDERVAQFE